MSREMQRRDLALVAGAAAAGWLISLALSLFNGWLAPPLFNYTPWLHALLSLLWLPFLLMVLVRRRVRLRWLLAGVALGGVVACFFLALLGPTMIYVPAECQPEPVDAAEVRFICVGPPNYQNARPHFALEGRAGFPFAHLSVIEWRR